MKTTLIYALLLLAATTFTFAQNDEKLWREEVKLKNGIYEENIIFHDKKKIYATVETFDLDGSLLARVHYRNLLRHGLAEGFYPDGSLHWKGDYYDNLLNGKFFAFYPDGSVKRRELYKSGYRKNGTCLDENGEETTCTPFQTEARFHGGVEALTKYMASRWPKMNHSHRDIFLLSVRLHIKPDGTPSLLSMDVDQPEYRVALVEAVSKMPKWKPATFDGEPSVGDYVLRLRIEMNQLRVDNEDSDRQLVLTRGY